MARGVKRPTDELLAELDGKIDGFKTKIKELEAQKKELLDAERQTKLQKLLDTMDAQGISVEDAIDKITK